MDDGLPARDMEALTDEIEQVDGIRQVLSYEKFLGGGVPREVLPTEVRQIFMRRRPRDAAGQFQL